MTTWSCEKFEARLEDFRFGMLSEGELKQAQFHLDICEHCREALTLWENVSQAIRTTGPDPLPPLVERRMILTAIRDNGRQPNRSRLGFKSLAAVGGVGLTIAAIIGVVSFSNSPERSPADPPKVADTPTPHESMPVPVLPNTTEPDPSPLPLEMAVTEDGRRVINLDAGIRLWLDNGAIVRAEHVTKQTARFRLETGRVVAQVDDHPPGYRFVIATPGGEVESIGTVFSVEVVDSRPAVARVLRGTIRVRSAGPDASIRQSFEVTAWQEGRVGDTEPSAAGVEELKTDLHLLAGNVPKSTSNRELLSALDAKSVEPTTRPTSTRRPSSPNPPTVRRLAADPDTTDETDEKNPSPAVDALFSQATEQRRAGDYATAAQTYSQLIRTYPNSSAALNATVSLGHLELTEIKQPAAALSRFERYLARAPQGFLAQEARVGKLRALVALRRPAEVKKAADDYFRAHPSGYAGAEALRKRGDAKVKLGDCPGAREDYRQLKLRWPASPENDLARRGLRRCGQSPAQ